ncbi:restriction endonuclease subunit S [Pseudomonas saliphila]|uniref:restriction endonuclease subunit S n=1 Tax=Pseudomonas saliphila TaxID=2586906 RepID=UPI001238B38E|nr:restriction endonuclease subunit S [Pseudomonas saliphila]
MSGFKPYPAYKDSRVEWLGAVPEHWSLHKLKYIARFSGGGTPSRESLAYWNGDIPWVSPKDMKVEVIVGAEENITAEGLQNSTTSLVPSGGILIVVRSGILKHTIPVAVNNIEVALNQDMKALRFNPKLALYSFFLRWVQGFNKQLLHVWLKQGATVESIEQEYLADTTVPMPGIDEQRMIVTFLNHETARIDALIAEQQRLIELLKEKRQAIISHVVTKGLDPTVPMKDSGMEWVGEVPVHWAVKRLKQLVLDAGGIQMGPFGGMLVELDDSDTGYKVYGQENTISGDFSSGNRWIPEHRYISLSNYHLEVGDIVLTRKGSLGNCRRVSLLPQAGIIDSDTIRVRVQDQTMDPDYLELLLHESDYISTQLNLVKRGAILSGLNSEIIANLVIIVPPRDAQEELVLEIKADSSKFNQGISDCEFAVGLLRERRSALISAAVTGKIDVRDWHPPAGSQAPVQELEEAV